MASSGFIMKNWENVEFNKLIYDIKMAADKANLEARIDQNVYENDFDGGVYTMGNIADTYEDIPEAQQWHMYIYSNDRDLHRFEHVVKKENMIRVIFIECVSDCEKILLDFLFEYFKLNPKDYFLVEEYEWYYTYVDIKKVKQNDFDPLWCYKDPHANDLNV